MRQNLDVVGPKVQNVLVLAGDHVYDMDYRPFIAVHRALVDARARRRPDLVERFTAELAMLVDNTNYEQVSRRLETA